MEQPDWKEARRSCTPSLQDRAVNGLPLVVVMKELSGVVES